MFRRYLCACLIVHGVALAMPASSLAYDWYWLDALSGPRFGGITFEWRAYCQKEERYLKRTRVALDKLDKVVEDSGSKRSAYDDLTLALATDSWNSALLALNRLLTDFGVAKSVSAVNLQVDLPGNREAAIGVRAVVDIYEETVRAQAAGRQKRMTGGPSFGALISLCTYEEREGRKASVNVLVGLLAERDDDNFFSTRYKLYRSEADDAIQNRLFIIEPSYSMRVNDFFDVAAGAGIGIFSSRRRASIIKLIIEPVRVDWRPFNRNWKNPTMKIVGEVITLRGGFFVFPQGFAPNDFADDTARIPAELVKVRGPDFRHRADSSQAAPRAKQATARALTSSYFTATCDSLPAVTVTGIGLISGLLGSST